MTAADHLKIWNALSVTDKKHTKPFKRPGGFSGTATKPIYLYQKMTEHFGPVGIGWGFSEPTYQLVNGASNEVLVYCWLSLWFVDPAGGARSEPVFGVGGDVVVKNQSNGLKNDDEAFKKAFTDALGNAMKHLGMSADIHMGQFDGSKYQADDHQEPPQEVFRPQRPAAKPTAAAEPPPAPSSGSTDLARSMADEIARTGSLGELDDLKTTPTFKLDYSRLDAAGQNAVRMAGERQRAKLLAPTGGG